MAIFDILIIREGDKLKTTVYRKDSEQAWREKCSAIKALRNRALDYCSDEDLLEKELTHLLGV